MSPQKTLFDGKAAAQGDARAERVVLEDDTATAVSPEGEPRSLKIAELLDRARPAQVATGDLVLPDGVKCAIPVGRGLALVHEMRPRVQPVSWIASDSPAPFGPGARYRDAAISLPYVVVIAVFDMPARGLPRLASTSECFFVNRSLDVDGLDTDLAYPALLNCSRFPDSAQHPLSWICVQHLNGGAVSAASTASEAYRLGLCALVEHLFGAAFNLSSEHHELSSWFTETVKAEIDPRLASIEAWEEATRADRCFALDVPWLPTGKTLGQVVQRIADARSEKGVPSVSTARDVMRVLFQRRAARRKTR